MCIENHVHFFAMLFFRTFSVMQHKMQHEKKETLISQGFFSAAGGTRTHTISLPPDFESGASASSATAANRNCLIIIS